MFAEIFEAAHRPTRQYTTLTTIDKNPLMIFNHKPSASKVLKKYKAREPYKLSKNQKLRMFVSEVLGGGGGRHGCKMMIMLG